MRYLIIGFIVAILWSLGSALFFAFRDRGQSTRTVKALTIRVIMSISLFILLILSFKLGWISPQGLSSSP